MTTTWCTFFQPGNFCMSLFQSYFLDASMRRCETLEVMAIVRPWKNQ